MLTNLAYILAFVIEPSYGKVLVTDSSVEDKNTKSNLTTPLDNNKTLNLLQNFAQVNNGNSFQSLAGNVNLPVSLSINPATLKLNFANQIVQIRSTPISPLSFNLTINNNNALNPLNRLFVSKDLSLNIPYIQIQHGVNGKQYYRLNLDQKNESFEVEEVHGKKIGKLFYTKLQRSKIEFIDEGEVKITEEDGTIYVFKRVETYGSYLYPLALILNNKGDYIQFVYDQDGIKIKNKRGDVIVNVLKMPSQTDIIYLDPLGREQTFRIYEDQNGKNIYLLNPLAQKVSLSYQDLSNITEIIFPNGVKYQFNYDGIKTVSYVIDGKTTPVPYNNVHVSQFTKHLSNRYSKDQTFDYYHDADGRNFAGNNIWCSKATFDQIEKNPLLDWMLECGLEHLDGVYGYTNWITSKTPVFNGLDNELRTMKVKQSFNYLHQSVGISVALEMKDQTSKAKEKLIWKEIDSQSNEYDQSVYSSKTQAFSNLSDSYQFPEKVTYSVFDLLGNEEAKRFIGVYAYYNSETKEAGKYRGALKHAVDAFGNVVEFQYYPESQAEQAMLKQQKMYMYDSTKTALVTNDNLSLLETQVNVDGTSYVLKAPYVNRMTSFFNGKKMNSTEYKVNSIPSSALYGAVNQSTELIKGQNAYIDNSIKLSEYGNDGYELWTEQRDLQADKTIGLVPIKHESEHQFFNAYGGLVRVVNPVSKDEIIYEDYDALGRVKRISYLPNGRANLKQTIIYTYKVLSDKNEAGYLLEMKLITPTTGSKGYINKTYYDNEGRVTRTEVQNQTRDGFYPVEEKYYEAGLLMSIVSYYYDEIGNQSPNVRRFFYDEKGNVTAVQREDGKTIVMINDDYRKRKLSYTLEPTTEVIEEKSLCFNPLISHISHNPYDTSGIKYTSCTVKPVEISETEIQNISSDKNHPLWQEGDQYHYGIIMQPDFRYTDETGGRMALYSKDQAVKEQIQALVAEAKKGRWLDRYALTTLADSIKKTCSSPNQNCMAMSFIKTQMKEGIPMQSENMVEGLMETYEYDKEQIGVLIGQTTSYKVGKVWHRLSELKYQYDDYGNVIKTELIDKINNKVIKVGTQSFSSLGYLLSSTTLLNDDKENIKIKYDVNSGLPIEFQDAKGNKVVTIYDEIWMSPKTALFYNTLGDKEFEINWTYDQNGNVHVLEKKEASGKLVSKTEYHYDPVTLSLTQLDMLYPDGSQRRLDLRYNSYGTLVEKSYQADGKVVLTQKSQSNYLGMLEKAEYQGASPVSLGVNYNPNLTVNELWQNNIKGQTYRYDVLGRLSKVENYLNGTMMRAYNYSYNKLGQKSEKIIQTEDNAESNLRESIERYSYTALGQLQSFICKGFECPITPDGKVLKEEYYLYNDALNQLKQVQSVTKDGAISVMHYSYDHKDPTQVSKIETKDNSIVLSYDENGNIVQMAEKNTPSELVTHQFTYDAAQNLIRLNMQDKEIGYTYDTNDRQVMVELKDSKTGKNSSQVNYYLDSLIEQKVESDARYYVGGGSIYHGEYQAQINDGFNVTGNVVANKIEGNYVYTPYGYMSDLNQAEKFALSVQKNNLSYRMTAQDQATGWQFLGDGYRAYNSELRIFMKHDGASPFGIGGINGYSYASNNPVNFFDPTGHATEADQKQIMSAMDVFAKNYKGGILIGVGAFLLSLVVSFIPGVGLYLPVLIGFVAEVITNVVLTGVVFGWGEVANNWQQFTLAGLINVAMGLGFVALGATIVRFYYVARYAPKGAHTQTFFKAVSNKQIKKDWIQNRTIEGYRLDKIIGKGEEGSVFLALKNEEKVAIKFKHKNKGVKSLQEEADNFNRFYSKREPELATAKYVKQDKALIMPYFEGQTVKKKLQLLEAGQDKYNRLLKDYQDFKKNYNQDRSFYLPDFHQGNVIIDNEGKFRVIDFSHLVNRK